MCVWWLAHCTDAAADGGGGLTMPPLLPLPVWAGSSGKVRQVTYDQPLLAHYTRNSPNRFGFFANLSQELLLTHYVEIAFSGVWGTKFWSLEFWLKIHMG
jgi:hypothetical protein